MVNWLIHFGHTFRVNMYASAWIFTKTDSIPEICSPPISTTATRFKASVVEELDLGLPMMENDLHGKLS